jgi:septum site-determining protein MinC
MLNLQDETFIMDTVAMRDLITIRGGKDGLRVQLDDDAEWHAVMAALQAQLDQSGSFFAGARLVVDIGDRSLSDQQLADALMLMKQYGVQPEALATTARESRNAARAAGVQARVTVPGGAALAPDTVESEALLLVRTVRSGQVVRHQGHITLIGDVNAGAEVIAGGSVVVWGRLRGLVHAGAFGDRSVLICALELRPTQLRIASVIARTPEEASQHAPVPEVARVDPTDQERITVEAWEVPRR